MKVKWWFEAEKERIGGLLEERRKRPSEASRIFMSLVPTFTLVQLAGQPSLTKQLYYISHIEQRNS